MKFHPLVGGGDARLDKREKGKVATREGKKIKSMEIKVECVYVLGGLVKKETSLNEVSGQ